MEFKEFLDTMSGQIRSQKARAVAVREMEDHIRDQADFYESQGMSGGDALKEAVRQMGDPVDVGVELDRIHRPDMEWRLFGWIVAFSGMGLVIQYLCFYCVNVAPGVNGQSQWILGDSTGSFVRQCVYTAVGLDREVRGGIDNLPIRGGCFCVYLWRGQEGERGLWDIEEPDVSVCSSFWRDLLPDAGEGIHRSGDLLFVDRSGVFCGGFGDRRRLWGDY